MQLCPQEHSPVRHLLSCEDTRSAIANYAIAPGNVVGEIIDGTAGTLLSASTSAWANLAY